MNTTSLPRARASNQIAKDFVEHLLDGMGERQGDVRGDRQDHDGAHA